MIFVIPYQIGNVLYLAAIYFSHTTDLKSKLPSFHSCGQGIKEGGILYQDMVCTDEDEGIECEVDEKMEIYGVTHASWIGAPQPLYCG